MKQTLYEKIRTVVESWNIAITYDNYWRYRLWSSITHDRRFIRVTLRCKKVDDCFDWLWREDADKNAIEQKEFNWERYIWIYERPLWRPTKWQKVSVWMEDKWSTIFWEVVDLTGTYAGVKIIDSIHPVPYDCIAPRVSPDE